uniref:Uncharacterized protein n=1 Tax=Arundo donax TaxID=35708 RepID=A0A0A8ZVT5_ARUDO
MARQEKGHLAQIPAKQRKRVAGGARRRQPTAGTKSATAEILVAVVALLGVAAARGEGGNPRGEREE